MDEFVQPDKGVHVIQIEIKTSLHLEYGLMQGVNFMVNVESIVNNVLSAGMRELLSEVPSDEALLPCVGEVVDKCVDLSVI